MQIGGINSLTGPSAFAPVQGAAEAGASGSPTGFGDAIKNVVESLDRSQKSSEVEIARAVTGESPDLHQTIIALQTADMQFQFALQVRNKLIGAYEEIMRMQV
jgi:flagellar hook-basal body complex protein FliE